VFVRSRIRGSIPNRPELKECKWKWIKRSASIPAGLYESARARLGEDADAGRKQALKRAKLERPRRIAAGKSHRDAGSMA